MNDAIIRVRDLSKHFGDKIAVNKISLTVNQKDIFGFLGPNGSGKTTTIRMLCGLLTPDHGEGTCLGYDIRSQSSLIKREVGYMTQRFSFYEDLTIRENLSFVARIYGMRDARSAVDHAIGGLGLGDRQHQLAGALSGGWKQRLALAACMLHRPRLLLLDEPTAGVDPQARRDFWDEIHGLAAQGVTVLVSTHYMDEAERCNRLAYISKGHLLAQGSPEELVGAAGLHTWVVEGPDMPELAHQVRAIPAAQHVVLFGNSLHVSGTDGDALEEALSRFRRNPTYTFQRGQTSLEDVFIHLMHQGVPS
ncbi:MAG: ABC transporter ATP-binding protein [Acidobacteria bacterium]|nr:ABC transporter ATP-binding protein [Acidobacteriota bacterium]